MRKSISRHRMGASLVAVTFMALSSLAHAQAVADVAPQDEAETTSEQRAADIVVTGSRITTSGFTAPTPTTVIGEEQIANNWSEG